METNIQIFTSDIFGEIRTCQVNNQIMFVGKDVAQALGYSNTRDALNKHVDAEDKLESQIATSGQRRTTIIINESGLYSLILSSRLPQARAFKRWVTSEVLPSIRKTGRYELPQLIPELAMLNADAEEVAAADQTADEERPLVLQTCCGECGVPCTGCSPARREVPLLGQRGARGDIRAIVSVKLGIEE